MEPELYPAPDSRVFARPAAEPDFLAPGTSYYDQNLPAIGDASLPFWAQGPAPDRGENRYARHRSASSTWSTPFAGRGNANSLKIPNLARLTDRLRFWK